MSHYDIISHATIQKECFDLYISLLHLMVVILCNENPFKHHPMSYRIFDHVKRNHEEMVDVCKDYISCKCVHLKTFLGCENQQKSMLLLGRVQNTMYHFEALRPQTLIL